MTARSSFTELQNVTRDLNRTSLPRLPPVPGSEGDVEFAQQLDIWRRWIQWEKGDPLVLKDEDLASFKARVVYVYKQALAPLRFLPEIWFDAAEFCFQNGMDAEGSEFLKQGIDANPESCLLAFKRADRLEIATESEQDSVKRGSKVRDPYDRLLDALYDLIAKARTRESQDVARIEQTFAETNQQTSTQEDGDQSQAKVKEAVKDAQVEAVRNAHAFQIGILSRTISFAWIALMRAMRRIQGKGKPGELPGSRQIFADARKKGRLTSDVYIASALIEYHCYKDPAATKIFERGAKLFPDDENFALEYLKHLIDVNDITSKFSNMMMMILGWLWLIISLRAPDARAVFEMTVRKLASNPNNVHRAKPIFSFLHEYESRYGDLVQVISLENRMRELFPENASIEQFSHRYSTPTFDPTMVRPILSASQTRPRAPYTAEPTEQPHQHESPPSKYNEMSSTNSPKRGPEEFDDDSYRPRKFVRAESPLKPGPARRAEKRGQQVNGGGGGQPSTQFKAQASPVPVPRDVVNLLSIIPPAYTYNAGRFSPERLVELLRRIDVPSSVSQIRLPQPMGVAAYNGENS